jgi:multicomponent Na+:H+ antiporter subunit D
MISSHLAALPVAIPLLTGGVLSAIGELAPRRIIDLISLCAAMLTLAICLCLVHATRSTPWVYWMGGWMPENRIALGISFFVDPIGAGLAALSSLLTIASLLFSWRYFKEVKSLFHSLMLIFLAAMCGFSLTGDLFNLFVWFEVMTAAGIALCGYKSEDVGSLQGAINFAVTNTIGAFVSLTGIGFLYARTGALNMEQVAAALARGGSHPDSLVIVAFLFFCVGFLVKAAAVPFHFWLADAHAVAPTPVSILFSGVMVELGLYAVVRVYWNVFSLPLSAHHEVISHAFLAMGASTLLLGGALSLMQRHLKRLLAYSTISHVGFMMIAFALSTDPSTGVAAEACLTGLFIYIFGHGLIKGALFVLAGILFHRFKSADQLVLKGKGKNHLVLAVLFIVAALGLAGFPLFFTFTAEALLSKAEAGQALHWLSLGALVCSALTAAAVFQAIGRIFFDWGLAQSETADESCSPDESSETVPSGKPIPVLMTFAAVLLIVLATVPSWPEIAKASPDSDVTWFHTLQISVRHLMNPRETIDRVLSPPQTISPNSRHTQSPPLPPSSLGTAPDTLGLRQGEAPAVHELRRTYSKESLTHAALSLIAALIIAAFGLFGERLARQREKFSRATGRILHLLHAVHSGQVGDYLTWFVVGIALYGTYFAVSLTR